MVGSLTRVRFRTKRAGQVSSNDGSSPSRASVHYWIVTYHAPGGSLLRGFMFAVIVPWAVVFLSAGVLALVHREQSDWLWTGLGAIVAALGFSALWV